MAVLVSILLMIRMLWFVGIITNTTLYSGLFADAAVTPNGVPDWAQHASPQEIEEFIAVSSIDESEQRKTHQADTLRMYKRRNSVLHKKKRKMKAAMIAVRAGNLFEGEN